MGIMQLSGGTLGKNKIKIEVLRERRKWLFFKETVSEFYEYDLHTETWLDEKGAEVSGIDIPLQLDECREELLKLNKMLGDKE